jgi:L-alanine-DL-glutamate epimerase-like enolase superfamily enzyme
VTDDAADLGRVESVTCAAYTVPTDRPESDGTLAWDSTTILVVHARGNGATGIGYSYTHAAATDVVRGVLAPVVAGQPAAATGAAWKAMADALRNIGRPGLASAALSAVDVALWDLKARLLGVSVAALTPAVRAAVPVYGSGGFTSYSDEQLREQLSSWVEQGMTSVKMKVGREPERDEERVRLARAAIGGAGLFVDANGTWSRKQALQFADCFADCFAGRPRVFRTLI